MPSQSPGPFDAAAILVAIAAAPGFLNHRFPGLPSPVGAAIMGAEASPGGAGAHA